MDTDGDPVLPAVPASEDDRKLAIAVLRDSAGRGLITLDELERRLPLVLQARTVGDLAALTWELVPTHVTVSSAGPHRWWRRIGFNYHAAAYGLTNSFLVGTWALTGQDFFWPFFPIMGWSIPLGIHALVAKNLPVRPPRPRPPVPRQLAARPAPPPRRPAQPAAVRYVVVMFADVVGSTRLNEALGDESWTRLRARHFQMLRDCIATSHGTEINSQGDGLFSRFDTPVNAVSCAVEIQRRIGSEEESQGFAPRVRIGIHAGEAIEEGTDLLGNVVNLAARVTSEAGPGQIMVTEPVADKVDARFDLEDHGLRTLKGISKPRHLLSVRH